ncbi:MAG: bifunctional UDP-N-acetylmuramoyl-tripeptide:D-alanyl-D-alanine ligase/alanine racemase [Chitinophagaceae bacterium]
MPYQINHIATILNSSSAINSDALIEHLLIDSRKISFPQTSLFFALKGPRRDGHQFIGEVYGRGVRNFVVEQSFDTTKFTDANFIIVWNVLKALQQLAAYHRKQFHYPVIGITGSNGKTIVKEWLNQLLQKDYNIVRSPRSYNSQVGVPLSVWQMSSQHTLAIFEAGISTVDEMQYLQDIIQPNIGILTNIGEAHSDGFLNTKQKIFEKIKLFKDVDLLVYNNDDDIITSNILKEKYAYTLNWGKNPDADLLIIDINKQANSTTIKGIFKKEEVSITIPFIDDASVCNACSCWVLLLSFKMDDVTIQQRMMELQAVEMRMQLLQVINNCTLLNDSYSNDISSFHLALDYLSLNATDSKKTVILSDFVGLKKDNKTYTNLVNELQSHSVNKFVGIGEVLKHHQGLFVNSNIETEFYNSTIDFLNKTTTHSFKDEYILLKGARVFNFERISKWLQQKTHQTVMEINLTALIHNLKEYQKHLLPTTKTMAMVKAFSYGSGSVEIAKALQFHKVDYLAVAYADEGIDLRKAGVSLPIMVLNVDEGNFDSLIEYNLEPEIFSFKIYNSFHQYLVQQAIQDFPIHIKLNTGMNRLGFEISDAYELSFHIKKNRTMLVKSVLSHLVSSEAKADDDFTNKQLELFDKACQSIETNIGYVFIKHIANSAAIFRHPQSQYNMVRLGIGLYGVDSAVENQLQLQTVSTLKTTIAQIRTVKANDTLGYNRRGVLKRDSKIATVRIGYADGFSRMLGNGIGSMYINGKLASVIGNVCMDMTMIDITDIENVNEDDVVEVFGKNLPVQQVAKWGNTIAYEILSTISQRVRRIYLEE